MKLCKEFCRVAAPFEFVCPYCGSPIKDLFLEWMTSGDKETDCPYCQGNLIYEPQTWEIHKGGDGKPRSRSKMESWVKAQASFCVSDGLWGCLQQVLQLKGMINDEGRIAFEDYSWGP